MTAQQESNPSGDTNSNREENLEFRLFDMNVISAATNNFATDSKIGQGGFGPVYKVIILCFEVNNLIFVHYSYVLSHNL